MKLSYRLLLVLPVCAGCAIQTVGPDTEPVGASDQAVTSAAHTPPSVFGGVSDVNNPGSNSTAWPFGTNGALPPPILGGSGDPNPSHWPVSASNPDPSPWLPGASNPDPSPWVPGAGANGARPDDGVTDCASGCPTPPPAGTAHRAPAPH